MEHPDGRVEFGCLACLLTIYVVVVIRYWAGSSSSGFRRGKVIQEVIAKKHRILCQHSIHDGHPPKGYKNLFRNWHTAPRRGRRIEFREKAPESLENTLTPWICTPLRNKFQLASLCWLLLRFAMTHIKWCKNKFWFTVRLPLRLRKELEICNIY